MVTMVKHKNRDYWLKSRKKYLGGSDISCILGMNPWKSNIQLFREKKGIVEPEDISDNPAIIYGTEAEEHIRALFQLEHPELKVTYVPNNSWHNTLYPFAAASLDGSSEDETGRKGILEIKTATITSAQQANKWKDEHIPDNYYCQVLYYLGVTEFDYVDLRARLKYEFPDNKYVIERDYHIERSEVEEDIETIMQAASAFAEALRKNKEPSLLLTL